MGLADAAFRQQFFRNALRGVLGLTVATPVVAILQGRYLLSDFRKNHRDAPFPDMPCSGIVVVHPLPHKQGDNNNNKQQRHPEDNSSSSRLLTPDSPTTKTQLQQWLSSFPMLRQQEEPDPLRLLVVGDSLAAGVGVTKSGTPVLPEAIAKSLSSALGGRAVYWMCLGEPGLSSPQIVKELLLAEQEDDDDADISTKEKRIDVMEELKDWWKERRQQQREQDLLEDKSEKETGGGIALDLPEGPGKKVRAWWKKVRRGVQKDVQELREKIHWRDLGESARRRLRVSKKIPEPAIILPQRRNTVVPDLVAQYDVAVVITGFNDLKNLIFPLPEDPNETQMEIPPPQARQRAGDYEDGLSSNSGFERDLLSIMRALQGKMRNYGINRKTDDGNFGEENESEGGANNPTSASNSSTSSDPMNDKHLANSSLPSSSSQRHHPMVVFPEAPFFSKVPWPLILFASPVVKLMEYQKKKLAERYPAPVLFLEAPNKKTISDFTNKRGPLWEARSKEEVLFELTNKARREQLEKLMKEYYDMWTVDVEEEEPTYTYDVFGPDIQGPLQHLHRSPLISPDNVHPSDEGYELWGRHIADGIVRAWEKEDSNS